MTAGRAERGTAVVEFALVLPLVLLVLAAVVEVALVARTQLELVNAAREGARTAATVVDPARAAAATRRSLGPAGAHARVSVSRPHVVGHDASVTVTVPHRVMSVLLGGLEIRLTARAVMRVER